MWNPHNPRERMWASRTRQLQQAHVSTHDRLWSTLPYLRPMATITDDTLCRLRHRQRRRPRPRSARHALGDPYVNKLLSGEDFHLHCHSNLTPRWRPTASPNSDVHDVLNVFQVTGLNDDDKYFMKACPAKPGDYLEFFAEMDLLCALSTCPGGDLSVPMWGPEARSHRRLPSAGRGGLCAGSRAAARLDTARGFTV